MSGEDAALPGPEGLSCYTANLAVYLGRHEEDALGRIAGSVRLAVRPGPPDEVVAFSHHRRPLDVLEDGGRLEYRGSADVDAALEAIADEVARVGQCLVVASTGYLEWSDAGLDEQAPHLLLLDDRRGEEWHVVDRFTALLPSGGGQRPFDGWVSGDALARYLTPISPLPAEQRLRNVHAFGFPRPLPPDGQYQWLVRTDLAEPGEPDSLDGSWLHGDAALQHLAELWAEPESARVLDDVWAAAQHHAFRYGHLVAETEYAEERAVLDRARLAWRDLPMALRFAVDSARRGRHRPTLVASTFAALRRVEGEAASLLEEGGPSWKDASRTPSGTAR